MLFWLYLLPLLARGTPAPRFADWAQAHGTTYETEEVAKVRAEVFRANVARVRELNELDPGVTYSVAGPFADLEPQEFAARLMSKRTAPDVPAESLLIAPRLSDSFDWTDKGAVGPVRDQKALGSCWAVSTAEAVEGQVAVTTGKLVPLSPEQLVECDASTDSSCGGGKGCADCGMFGGWPYLAYQYLEKAGGMFSEADWPYWATGMYPCMPQGYSKPLCGNHDDLFCKANSTKGQGPLHLCHASHGFAVRVTGWRALSRNETELAMQMVQYGPLSVLIEADSLQFYHSGIWRGGVFGCQPDPGSGILGLDHAVLLVGYGQDRDILGKTKPYWRLKNSWGTSWGEKGFFRLERGTGRCGVNLAATTARVAETSLVV
ncbi:Cysteine proteinase RD19a [Symbiodinium microadriaticum]|uniref:Cysteine proteinase RD19a n=1 Tax=Symbiodinium microadriaticum TaxID=2951 RepID=A0A1Q9ER94_SYMMI|nr:Cysteine proteinase RD19a [Symbiodinium microadriaticum]